MEVLPEAHERSSKQREPPENLQKKEAMANGQRRSVRLRSDNASSSSMHNPFSQRLPLFYSSRREPFTSLTIYLPNITT